MESAMTRILIIATLAAATFVAAAAGCRREPGEAATPTTKPAATVAAPATSVWSIANRDITFPPARLAVDKQPDDSGITVRLYCDVPEGADGFYLEMTVDVPDESQLDGASWEFRDASDDRSDSTNLIRVESGAAELQPRDVTVTFHATAAPDLTEVRVNGFFNVFAGREGATAVRQVPISATILAKRAR
jgi:hypothetical protein